MAKIIHDLSFLDIAPPSISNDKTVKSIITAINPELKSVSEAISDAFIISRINELPERVIDLLAWQWHVDFYEPDLDLATKRALVLASIKYHKKKGTKYAIKTALEALGFVPTIKEWFETDMGTAPHTFSITGHYKDDEINVDFLGEDTEEILKRVVEITKPVRSSLIYLLVAPTPMDLSEHICYWDVCNWEHFKPKIYNFGSLIPENPLFDKEIFIKRLFEKEIYTVHDTAYWNINAWDCVPVRLLQTGPCSETGITASLEWGEGEKALLYPTLWDYSKWDYASLFIRSVGSTIERIFNADFDFEDKKQLLSRVIDNRILYDFRPVWDSNTWIEHDKWIEDFDKEIFPTSSFERLISASLSILLNYKWDKNLTWSDYDAWENTSTVLEPALWDNYSWDKIPFKIPKVEPKWIIYAEDEATSKHDADFWKEIVQKKFTISLNLDDEAKPHEIQSEVFNTIPYVYDGENISESHSYNRDLDVYEIHDTSSWDINNWDNVPVKSFELSPEWQLSKQEQQEIINSVAIWDVNIWDGIEN